MGIYLEAADGLSKDDWIKKYGTKVNQLKWPGHEKGYYPVVVCHNKHFNANLVCWLRSEVKRVLDSIDDGDPRPFTFYHVKRTDLHRALGASTWEAMMQDIADGWR